MAMATLLEPAVFSRNWLKYLRGAVGISRSNPRRLITFRSNVAWAAAQRYVTQYGSLPIYFAVNDQQPTIQYGAVLRELLLRPRSTDPAAKRLLALALPATKREGIWREGRGTLYAISGCHKLRHPFPQTQLLKLADGTPIDRRYRRSYVLVGARLPVSPSASIVAVDTQEPPRRVQSHTYRVIRDTRIVQILKQFHAHRCQICGTALKLPDGSRYSEGHHLRPLGKQHNGPDVTANIIILCPNHHALCDLGAIRLSPSRLRHHREHRLGKHYLAYHNTRVFGRVLKAT